MSRCAIFGVVTDLSRKGDYHRYLAEFALGDKRKDSADKSLDAYKAASDVAVTELPPTHPVLLPKPPPGRILTIGLDPPWSCAQFLRLLLRDLELA